MVSSPKHCPRQSNSSDHRMKMNQCQYRWNLMLLRIQMKVILISSEHWLPSWERAAGDMMCWELVKGWGKIWMIPGIQWCWLLAAYLKTENTHFIKLPSFQIEGIVHFIRCHSLEIHNYTVLSEQIVETLIRCSILVHLIWVCTIWQ